MQAQAFALSSATSLSLNSSNTSLGWTISKYKNHQIAFSDLGGVNATIWVFPAAAGANQYSIEPSVSADNKVKVFNFADYGPIGAFSIRFDAGFTGTVYFGSSETGAYD